MEDRRTLRQVGRPGPTLTDPSSEDARRPPTTRARSSRPGRGGGAARDRPRGVLRRRRTPGRVTVPAPVRSGEGPRPRRGGRRRLPPPHRVGRQGVPARDQPGQQRPHPPARGARCPHRPRTTGAGSSRWPTLGIRVIRIYTLHAPAFYDELDAWNRAHATPLYLVQGVYLPDETYTEAGPDPLHAGGRRRLRRRSCTTSPPPSTATSPPPAGGPLVQPLAHRRVALDPQLDRRRGVGPGGHRPTDALAVGAVPARPVLRRDRGRHEPPSAGSPATSTRWPRPSTGGGQRADRVRQLADRRPPRAPRGAAGPEEDLVGVDAEPRAALRRLAGRDVRELPRLPVLPRLPAPRARAPGRDRRQGGPVRRVPAGADEALRLHAAADHRVRGAVLARLRAPRPARARPGRAQRAGGDADQRRADAADPRPGPRRGVRLLLGRRVVQADLEHRGEPCRRASAALARPADQRAVVRCAGHRRRGGAGRRPGAGAVRRGRSSTCWSARTRRTSISTSPDGTRRRRS